MADARSTSSIPVVSVILPIYNSERYIVQAIESILSQTWGDFELIGVDDGSKDSTPRLLAEIAARDARVRIISRPNTGIVGALNDGLAVARGEFIARMDADDLSLPERFSRQVAFLRAHPEVVAVGCNVLRIDPDDRPIGPEIFPTDHATILQKLRQGEGGTIPHPGVMMRRSAVEAIGGYRQKFQWVEDLDLYLRLGEVGELANLPETLLSYRFQFESVNMTRQGQQAAIILECLRETAERTGQPIGDAANVQRWLSRPLARPFQRQSWARRALACGLWSTARALAGRNVLSNPFKYDHWRVFLLSLLRRQKLFAKGTSTR